MRTRPTDSSSDPVPPPSGKGPEETHRPVLLHEVIDVLALEPDDVVLDATLGGAGHARAILERLGERGAYIGIDADARAIRDAQRALQGSEATVHLVEGNFRDARTIMAALSVPRITKALFDLGWSSAQLGSGRGFSFMADEPLLMTYSEKPADAAESARTIVNSWAEESIADVLWGWGGERYARRIAKAIAAARTSAPIDTSRELAEIVASAVPAGYRRGRTHPATKTFQALRIAVNDEMGALDEGIRAAWELLERGGRLAVITFHSLEDRAVKTLLREWASAGEAELLLKKPLRATKEELRENPRARSAKLRAAQKRI
ncbi:16S rRNA (cytosine(1402)-N(4))-methyltransferase [Candidatus Kaiserbacteria bacterium CG10_big_fil_rev_8_21_14_0_10_59_10]|uniref:Ribosomal RNA small subunit methyltransferase H n=1 Tax=Candidatus Kaiserbacteria bacterium CG10_big_fil_rev_8_21_14_0_10_59_10 TaxID=1974612 RepID=A0A2H0U794_9BACT|nr:MAG: 16S rRNA (cytosine(1402)-N(4))-methyltransferase [Candidatus Kaiserbacteria bacterium CG10_big_fil_rev_8_21_14_0_10_59_10]